jgi:O-succinylbenzoic acid--CoA ligase
MILDNWLAQRAETCPDRLALVGEGLELTYGMLEDEATSAARRLAARGVRRGATVTLTLPPGIEHAVTLHALMKLGAVAYPLSPRLAEPELAEELRRARPVLAISEPGQLTATEADLPLLGEHDLDALHCRILTSGTGARPRAVGLTYGNHLWSAVGSAFNLGVEPTDRWLCCLPFHHVAGLSVLMRSVVYGTGVVIHDGFDVDAVGRVVRGRRGHRGVRGRHPAHAPARGRGGPAAAAGGPRGRRAGAGGGPRGGGGPRRDGGPDLRAHGGGLAGDDRLAR